MSSETDAVQKFSGGAKQFGTALIANLAITTAKIADLAVTTAKIAALAVTTAKIAALAVTTAKINDLAVTTAKIAALNITTALLAALAVTRAKMGADSLEFIYRTQSENTSQNVTEFLGLTGESASTTEAQRQVLALRDGKLTRMKVRIASNTLDVICTYVVNIGGVPTALTLAIPAASTTIATITADVDISEDDQISIEASAPAGAGTINAQVELEGGYDNS